MKCSRCNGEQYQLPEVRSASEVYVCSTCKNELFVRSNYQVSGVFKSTHSMYEASCSVTPSALSAKIFIKLKNILKKYDSFKFENLEYQFLQKHSVWNLGIFLDFEVKEIQAECKRLGVSIDFACVENDLLFAPKLDGNEMLGETQEVTKQEFKNCFLKYGKASDGWGIGYWDQFFEKISANEMKYLVQLPTSYKETRMMITSDYSKNEVRLFFVTEEQEEHIFRS